MTQAWDPIPFLTMAQRLKRTPRRGWLAAHPARVESVAEHSYGVAILALLLGDHLGLDRGAMVAMALVHDLAEALTGDIIPSDGVPREERKRREEEALHVMCADLDPREAGSILDLWRRFEFGGDPEAVVMRELDKLDVAFQARAYEDEGLDPGALEVLWTFARENIHHRRLVLMVDRLGRRG